MYREGDTECIRDDRTEELVGGLGSVFETPNGRFDSQGHTGEYVWDDGHRQWEQ